MFVEIEYSKHTGHLVELVLSLTETLLRFCAEHNQHDLRLFSVRIRRGGYVGNINVLSDKVSTHPRKPSERGHIARRRPFPG